MGVSGNGLVSRQSVGLALPTLAFFAWSTAALVALIPLSLALDAAIPIFTFVWIGVPLVSVARSRDAAPVGFRAVPAGLLGRTTAANLALVLAIMLALEPFSHTYERLVDYAVSAQPLDSTFAWLVRLDRIPGIAAMSVYAGLVTMFGEELFFRGWLLHWFRRRMPASRAILLQAALFAVPQAIAATVMSPGQAVVYVFGYSWLAIGVVGGWAASRTGSIWPSLLTATIANLLFVAWVL